MRLYLLFSSLGKNFNICSRVFPFMNADVMLEFVLLILVFTFKFIL